MSSAVNDAHKQKTQLSAEEIRKRRKERAAARRQRILAGSAEDGKNENVRLQFAKGLTSTDTLKKAEQQTHQHVASTAHAHTQRIIDEDAPFIRDALNADRNTRNMNSHPGAPPNFADFMQSMQMNGGLPQPPAGADMNGMNDMNDMMNQMLQGLLGGENSFGAADSAEAVQRTKERMEHAKQTERFQKYDARMHDVFAVVFAAILVFLPSDYYDVSLMGYNLLSDSWTFFIALEMILFSIMYAYQRVKNPSPVHANEQSSMNAAGPLLSTLGLGIGASLLGANGGEMMQRIQTWTQRMSMVWSYIKMFRQMMSDLCVVLFLWIILTAVKSLFLSVTS